VELDDGKKERIFEGNRPSNVCVEFVERAHQTRDGASEESVGGSGLRGERGRTASGADWIRGGGRCPEREAAVVSRAVAPGFPTMQQARASITVASALGEPICGVVSMEQPTSAVAFSDEGSGPPRGGGRLLE
jgi:hypothetical protein